MQIINAMVLPGLALIVMGGTAIMAWLIYRTPNIKKERPAEPSANRAAARRKHVL